MLLAHASQGVVLQVPGQYPTIQAGINAAGLGDTVMVAAGTYSGLGNYNLDFGGRAITVMSATGPEYCTINCQRLGRGAYFHSGETAASVLSGFMIIGGYSSLGGGINVTGCSPTIERCIIWGNASVSSYGGGLYITDGNPAILNCTLYGDTALYGGAIYAANSAMVINSCIIAGNLSFG
jgi:hypothetical protein